MRSFIESPVEQRSEDRRIVNKYYTIEILVHDIKLEYRFKIWDISSKGISLLNWANSGVSRPNPSTSWVLLNSTNEAEEG